MHDIIINIIITAALTPPPPLTRSSLVWPPTCLLFYPTYAYY